MYIHYFRISLCGSYPTPKAKVLYSRACLSLTWDKAAWPKLFIGEESAFGLTSTPTLLQQFLPSYTEVPYTLCFTNPCPLDITTHHRKHKQQNREILLVFVFMHHTTVRLPNFLPKKSATRKKVFTWVIAYETQQCWKQELNFICWLWTPCKALWDERIQGMLRYTF